MTSTLRLAVSALLGFSGLSQAALTTSVGPAGFSSTVSVTATATNTLSATANNNGAGVASLPIGQFDAATGVLTNVDLALTSNRTQTLSGTGFKNNGSPKTASGSGTSDAALSTGGVNLTFPSIAQTGGSCNLAGGLPGNCGWGPANATPVSTDATASVGAGNLDDYVGPGTINATLALPNLSATTTITNLAGPNNKGSTTTYNVNWSGNLQATYTYLLHAAPSFDGSAAENTLTLNFGNVAQGSGVAPLAFSLFNLGNSNRVGLDLDSLAGSGDTGALGTNLAGFTGLAQGDSNPFTASLDTSLVGLFSAQYVLNLSDADVGASSTRGNYQLTLNLLGNVTPVPVPAAVWLFGSALAGLGFVRRRPAA